MPNSYAVEAVNGVVVSTYPNKEAFHPHCGLTLSALVGEAAQPVVVMARLNPDEARCLGNSLVQGAEFIQEAFDEYLVEVKADGSTGE